MTSQLLCIQTPVRNKSTRHRDEHAVLKINRRWWQQSHWMLLLRAHLFLAVVDCCSVAAVAPRFASAPSGAASGRGAVQPLGPPCPSPVLYNTPARVEIFTHVLTSLALAPGVVCPDLMRASHASICYICHERKSGPVIMTALQWMQACGQVHIECLRWSCARASVGAAKSALETALAVSARALSSPGSSSSATESSFMMEEESSNGPSPACVANRDPSGRSPSMDSASESFWLAPASAEPDAASA